ncbi:hypothetical protein GCM10010156_33590 [Planobispora rosea]|uniref:Uncharacterized protein n=2 Tax=Planobispora rosea TaxID=35762 RepID=A0A8J3S1B6_PLARO|nr:hypothetical protein [Planobispora rosea]GGS72048.1 hypothetical protein GCM10010156_33590 [Planobispora rosea]GIH85223.1 hypothetical protein Pro02_36310 [Planobispora rosea]
MSEYPTGAGDYSGQSGGAQTTAQQAKSAAGEVAQTAKEQTRVVAGEARNQARRVVGQLRDRVGEQTQHQSRRAAQGIRQWADDLSSMKEAVKPDSPVHGAVQQIADSGRRAADYLEENGLAGVVDEVQNFARRRPGLFLAGAVVAGFLAGRVAKATAGVTSEETTSGTVSRGTGSGSTFTPTAGSFGQETPVRPMTPPAHTTSPYQSAQPAEPLAQPTYPESIPAESQGAYPPNRWDGES